MIVHVVVAQRRHGVPEVVEGGGGGAVMVLVVVLVEAAEMVGYKTGNRHLKPVRAL